MKNNKIYNVLFPIWLLYLYPVTWLIIIPGNFIIDSLVLIISMFILKIVNKKELYKKSILKIFIIGFLSDIIGALFLLITALLLELSQTGDDLYLTIPAVIISLVLIFLGNYFFTFKKLDKKLRFKLSLILAVVTAPYTFLIPISWIY